MTRTPVSAVVVAGLALLCPSVTTSQVFIKGARTELINGLGIRRFANRQTSGVMEWRFQKGMQSRARIEP